MPISSKSVISSTVILLVVGLVALLGIVGTVVWLVERTQVHFEEVVEARLARIATVDLRTALQDVQAGQRGYLLTQDEAYLAPYDAARGNVMPYFERLREVLARYPQAAQPLARLETILTEKLDELDQTVALVQGGDLEGAIAIVRTDEGQALMDEARTLFDAIVAAADRRTEDGVQDQHASVLALRLVAIAGALVIIGVAGGSVVTVLRYTRELGQARTELETLNADLEERVTERTDELMRANEEVQRFAYIVTHDLRAPLVNIMGFTSELEASLNDIRAYIESLPESSDPTLPDARAAALEDLPEAIGFIRSSTRKMDGLINAILRISREGRRELKPETIDLNEVLSTTADSVQHQVSEEGGGISIDVRSPKIVSDRIALEQVFGNLFDNAIKYKKADEAVQIKVRSHQDRAGRIHIEVEDNGRGIAPNDHQRVFELFRRSGAQDQSGEGIGLTHVRTVVRNLGGDISLDSALGHGTTFKIHLPPDLRAIRSHQQ